MSAILAVAAFSLHALGLGVTVASYVVRHVRDRASRPRARRPRGPLRVVRGIARGPHAASPLEGVPCLFAWIRLVSENNPFHRVRREVAVGPDFVLESGEGRFTVRLDGARLVGAPSFGPMQPLESAPPEVIAEVIESARMERPFWAEVHVRDGDELEVTGVCRMEPVPGAVGFREDALCPTLSGAGGRLDLRFIG